MTSSGRAEPIQISGRLRRAIQSPYLHPFSQPKRAFSTVPTRSRVYHHRRRGSRSVHMTPPAIFRRPRMPPPASRWLCAMISHGRTGRGGAGRHWRKRSCRRGRTCTLDPLQDQRHCSSDLLRGRISARCFWALTKASAAHTRARDPEGHLTVISSIACRSARIYLIRWVIHAPWTVRLGLPEPPPLLLLRRAHAAVPSRKPVCQRF